MSKQLTLIVAAYHKLKANRKENSTKYAGSIDKCVKKTEKIGRNHEKVVNKPKEQDPSVIMKDNTHFSL